MSLAFYIYMQDPYFKNLQQQNIIIPQALSQVNISEFRMI